MNRLAKTGLLATLYFAIGGVGCSILLGIICLINAGVSFLVMLGWNTITPDAYHISWLASFVILALLTLVSCYLKR